MHPLKRYRSHSRQVQSPQQQVHTHFKMQRYVLNVVSCSFNLQIRQLITNLLSHLSLKYTIVLSVLMLSSYCLVTAEGGNQLIHNFAVTSVITQVFLQTIPLNQFVFV